MERNKLKIAFGEPLQELRSRLRALPICARFSAAKQIKKIEKNRSYPFQYHNISEKNAIELPEVIKSLKCQRRGRKRCNIIGSGMTANLAVADNIEGDAACYACNFAGLLPIQFDLYLIEVASEEPPHLKEISDLQHEILSKLGERAGLLFLKNIWEGKISNEYILKRYPENNILYDNLFPMLPQLIKNMNYKCIFDYFFFRESLVLFQIYTTVLTLLQLAVRAGYTDIKIFGLDGQGPHFFHSEICSCDVSLLNRLRDKVPPLEVDQEHKVGAPGREMAKLMADYLNDRGIRVELVSA